jgi:integrase
MRYQFSKNRGFTMHNDFTLFTRKHPSGKKVVYYYAYDDEGIRIGPWTTGLPNKTAARKFCNDLIRKDLLVPGIKGMTTFESYAAEFWDWDNSEYLKDRRKRRKLTQGYAEKCKKVVEKTLIPYFGKMRMDRMSGEAIDKWLDYMIAEKYENSTINGYFGTLKTMMKWAAKKKYIVRDPFLDVKALIDEQKKKEIITHEEFKMMFVEDWKKVWNNDLTLCIANKLAALTGMRVSEIVGLKGDCVFDKHIFVHSQYQTKYGDCPTKDKGENNIPLTAELVSDLKKLKKVNGNGYLFSLTGGDKPVTIKHIYNGLRRALRKIGLSDEEIKQRRLNVHAWRHFCNTELLKGGVPENKVQKITRHKSKGMTNRYTHFNPLEFTEVTKIQADLLKKKPDKQSEAKNESPVMPKQNTLTLVKPQKENEAIQQAS